MSSEVEPSIAELARAWESSVTVQDWEDYVTCKICRAPAGKPCTAMYQAIMEGQRQDGPVELAHAHGFRKRRRGR